MRPLLNVAVGSSGGFAQEPEACRMAAYEGHRLNAQSPPVVLTGSERESFFAAQTRYRASARRWTVAMGAFVFAITLVISLLLAPLAFALLGLLADFVNLVVPTPDLLGALGRVIDAGVQSHRPALVSRIVELTILAALPGFALLIAGWRRLGRIAIKRDLDALRAGLGMRDPKPDDLEELQLTNLVEEMAIAAGRPAPRLQLIDGDACNLGLYGNDTHAAIFVTRGLLDRLDRAETQALIGQAVAALGNGDGLLAERLLHLELMIGLLTLLAQAPMDAAARATLRSLLRMRRGAKDMDDLTVLRSVLGDSPAASDEESSQSDSARSWHDWILMPLMGSMLIGILIVPVSVMLFVAPLNGMIWRRRRLLADAMAVQFTRDPEALANAYVSLSRHSSELDPGMRWLGNVFLLRTRGGSVLDLGSPCPRYETRVARLDALGASVALPARPRMPWWVWVVLAPLGALLLSLLGFVIVMGTWLSLAINALFLALPTAFVHLVLRAIGH
jgi:Zn-dependent protease with chaperone function